MMRWRDFVNWLSGRRSTRSFSEQMRYDDAARLEERTQSHYRSVTGSDAKGQSTKANDADASNVSR